MEIKNIIYIKKKESLFYNGLILLYLYKTNKHKLKNYSQ